MRFTTAIGLKNAGSENGFNLWLKKADSIVRPMPDWAFMVRSDDRKPKGAVTVLIDFRDGYG